MRLEDTLTQIGINGKLAKFYLAALELGEATVHEVARKAAVTRSSAYDLFDKLLEAKLVTRLEKSGKYLVIAEDPSVLLQLTQNRLRHIGLILPTLRSIYNGSVIKPKIHFYEGPEGVQTVLSDTLECQEPLLLAVLTMPNLFELRGRARMKKYISTRIEKGIVLRVVRPLVEKSANNGWVTSSEEKRELRYAPAGVGFSMNVFVYDDKVAMVSSKRENFGMMIESREFNQFMRSLFVVLWNASTE